MLETGRGRVGQQYGWADRPKELIAVDKSALTPAQYGQLAEVPPELEWLANLTSPKTRRAYKIDVEEFIASPACAVPPSCTPLPAPMSSPGAT